MAGQGFRKGADRMRKALGRHLPVSCILPLYVIFTIACLFIIIGPVYMVYRDNQRFSKTYQVFCATNFTHWELAQAGPYTPPDPLGNDCYEYRVLVDPVVPANVKPSVLYIEASIVKIDTDLLAATVVFMPQLTGRLTTVAGFSVGWLNATAYNVPANQPIVPSAVTLKLTMAGANVNVKVGDKLANQKVEVPLRPIKGQVNYPLDSYSLDVTVVALVVNGTDLNNPSAFAVPLILKVTSNLNAWSVQSNPPQYASTVVVNEFGDFDFTSGQGFTTVTAGLTYSRTSLIKFFALFVILLMWALSAAAFVNALDVAYVRTKEVAVGDVGALTGLLFALPNVRKLQPGVPDQPGTIADQLSYYWCMVILAIAAILVFCVLVGQFAIEKKDDKKDEKKDEKKDGKADEKAIAEVELKNVEAEIRMPVMHGARSGEIAYPKVNPLGNRDARVFVGAL